MKRSILNYIIILFLGGLAHAQLSPGDLHKSHAQLEGLSNCTKCHDSEQQFSSEKCLNCHTILKSKIEQQIGLHAQNGFEDCADCHIEHQGRDFELIYWEKGQATFNHSLTGYDLQGKHIQQECRSCHRHEFIGEKSTLLKSGKDLKRTFLGLKPNCISCHQDEHRGQFKENCESCHSMDGWKKNNSFDHAKSRFPLTGKHKNADCIKCHPSIQDNRFEDDNSFQKFTDISFNNCNSCHQDVHQGRLGPDCRSCHNSSAWASVEDSKFDHNSTLFPLKGKHKHVKCSSCHEQGKSLKITRFERCQDCHSDFHRKQFMHLPEKGACESCHTVDGFSPAKFTTKQHSQSRFPLSGAHLALPCFVCHQENSGSLNRFQYNSIKCIECHKDPHLKSVDKFLALTSQLTLKDGCAHCHQSSSWSQIQFDHNQTNFNLDGHHLDISCKSCHKNKEQQEIHFASTPNRCSDCHQDVHAGQFTNPDGTAADCSRCHSSTDWMAEKFDHNQDTQFKLADSHLNVPCTKCHLQIRDEKNTFIRYKPIDVSCKSCHGQEVKKVIQ